MLLYTIEYTIMTTYTEAHKRATKKWREANRDTYLNKLKEYMTEHKDHLKELGKEYYQQNKDKKKEASLKRYYFKKAWTELLQMEV